MPAWHATRVQEQFVRGLPAIFIVVGIGIQLGSDGGGGWIQPILCDTRGWFLNLGLRVSCHSRLSCSHPWTSENDPSKCQQIKCAAVLGLLLGVGAVGMVCVGQKSARKSGGLHLESALGANREHWRATPHGTIPQQGSAGRDPSKPVFFHLGPKETHV